MEAALQLHRATCVRQAAICDREASDARDRNDWVGETFAVDFAAMYRRKAVEASIALITVHRVMQ